MHTWALLGAGAAFLVAALISVGLGGPAWPYYLGMGVVLVVASFVLGWKPRYA